MFWILALPTVLAALVAEPAATDAPATPVLSAPSTPAAPTDIPASVNVAPSAVIQAPPATNTQPLPARGPSPQFMQRRMADVQRTLDEQRLYRRTMLAALTPAHQQLLAQIVAQLVIAPYPDVEAATRRLNAALSAGETQNVMRLEQAKETAMLQRFEQMAAESGMRSPQASQITVNAHASMPFGSDAASILLRTATMTLLTPPINVIMPGMSAH